MDILTRMASVNPSRDPRTVTSVEGSLIPRIMKACSPPSTAKGTPSISTAANPLVIRLVNSSMVVTWSRSVKPSTSSRIRLISCSGGCPSPDSPVMGRITALAMIWRSTIPSMETTAAGYPHTVRRRMVRSALTPNRVLSWTRSSISIPLMGVEALGGEIFFSWFLF